ncbi:MAG: endo-1,4-beta-xylanase [Polyangiaceae bacterium]
MRRSNQLLPSLILCCTFGSLGCDDGSEGSGPVTSAGGYSTAIGGSGPTSTTSAPVTVGGNTSTGTATHSGGSSSATGGSSSVSGGTSSASTLSKFVGNITTDNACDTGGKTFSKYWDQITPENAGKWGSVQTSPTSSFNWSALDAIYGYATKNKVIFKQHTFVWGNQQPSGSITETHVKSWMTEFCKRYPETKLIDVVNEPPPHTTPAYADAIGGGTNGTWKWIINAFTWARTACPNAILILNDYNNIEWPSENQHFIDIVKTAKAAGAPIDAVGAQSHDLDHAQVTTATMKELVAKLNQDTGLPVYITEYDISTTDDNAQLAKYKEHIPFFLETNYIKGVTIWGWIYGKTWSQAPDSGLIRNGTARPAMTWLMQTLGRPAP